MIVVFLDCTALDYGSSYNHQVLKVNISEHVLPVQKSEGLGL